MIASAITLVMAGGILVTQLFGMRVFEATSSKMGVSLEARNALNRIMDDVRSARKVRVGIQIRRTFIEASGSNPRVGNAILLSPDANSSSYVRYELDFTTGNLRRTTNGTQFETLSEGITNFYVFRLEDFRGAIVTQAVNRSVVGVNLEYNPSLLSGLRLGTNPYYSGYQLRTKVAHREVN